jgi:hypothetical protein
MHEPPAQSGAGVGTGEEGEWLQGAGEEGRRESVWRVAVLGARADGRVRAPAAREGLQLSLVDNPRPPPSRTNRTRRVPHPVLIGHVASLTPY